ncbi:hypothetical protein [Desulfonema magnum]|uniref:Uncharacterized protein n=1 Tax=Desulfonema magnum TaxID=45655 RepID=A0A975GSV8_9BACT|nr:hypothetical protein [Desulfonema magnum]QTA91483.1 Uncharacterized protein dnm_075510 [Desulfonema magnum]
MTEEDLYRFAFQHFSAAKEWRDNITDIVLASGKAYSGRKEIQKGYEDGSDFPIGSTELTPNRA